MSEATALQTETQPLPCIEHNLGKSDIDHSLDETLAMPTFIKT